MSAQRVTAVTALLRPEDELVGQRAVGADAPDGQPVADDVDVEELERPLGHGGERAASHLRGLAPTPADHVRHPVLRHDPLVVVVVAGEHEVDSAAGEEGGQGVGARGAAVHPGRVRRMVQRHDLPLVVRGGEGVVEPGQLVGPLAPYTPGKLESR